MLKEILYFHTFPLELHVTNDNKDFNGDNDCVLLSGGYSVPDSILRDWHTCCHFTTQQPYEVMLSQFAHFTDEGARRHTFGCVQVQRGSCVEGLPFDSRGV